MWLHGKNNIYDYVIIWDGISETFEDLKSIDNWLLTPTIDPLCNKTWQASLSIAIVLEKVTYYPDYPKPIN